jgi:hypothetical protein
LYCGTEYGMYVSYDDGLKWRPLQLNLPIVPITDLTLKENDLIVATQGRSFWVLDDLSMIQQYDENLVSKEHFIADINPTFLYDGYQNKFATNAGMNPPNGVVINYYLKNISDSSNVAIKILDKNKKLIKSFTSKAADKKDKIDAEQGMNQFVWDTYYPAADKADDMILWNGPAGGPRAAPGKYFIELKIGKDSISKEFELKANPVYKCSQADYEAQFDFLIQVRDKFTEVQTTIKEIREIRRQMNDFANRQGKDYPKEIKTLADTIQKKMTKIEEALYQTKLKSSQDILNYPMRLNDRISALYNYASSGNNAPAKQVKEAYVELSNLADIEINQWKAILNTEVVELNSKIKEMSLPVIKLAKD